MFLWFTFYLLFSFWYIIYLRWLISTMPDFLNFDHLLRLSDVLKRATWPKTDVVLAWQIQCAWITIKHGQNHSESKTVRGRDARGWHRCVRDRPAFGCPQIHSIWHPASWNVTAKRHMTSQIENVEVDAGKPRPEKTGRCQGWHWEWDELHHVSCGCTGAYRAGCAHPPSDTASMRCASGWNDQRRSPS